MDRDVSSHYSPPILHSPLIQFPQVSFYTLVIPLASSMMAPGLPDLALKYDIKDPTILALAFSIFLLSFAIGPLFLSPLSEMYGRAWVYPYVLQHIPLLTTIRCCTSQTLRFYVSTWDVLWHQLPILLLLFAFSVRLHSSSSTRPQLKLCRWLCWGCPNHLRWRGNQRPLRREGSCIRHGIILPWPSDR